MIPIKTSKLSVYKTSFVAANLIVHKWSSETMYDQHFQKIDPYEVGRIAGPAAFSANDYVAFIKHKSN